MFKTRDLGLPQKIRYFIKTEN